MILCLISISYQNQTNLLFLLVLMAKNTYDIATDDMESWDSYGFYSYHGHG